MTVSRRISVKTFLAVLCLSAGLVIPANAEDIVFLPDIPANQIAQDSIRSFDKQTGVSVVNAPTFDPFEQDDTLAGTAALRSGPNAITLNGQHVGGGAYLDLKMIYTSASDDPYDIRGFEQAYYVSGDSVSRISQDVRTLDCASNITEVVYEDDYYTDYNSFGYLAGIHLLLPRYRGHRNYWISGARHRPFAGWSDWRYRSSFSTRNRGRSRNRGFETRDTRRNNRRGRGLRINDRNETRNNDRRERAERERHNGQNSHIGGSAENRSFRPRRGVVKGEPLSNKRSNVQPDGNVKARAERRGNIPSANSPRQPNVRTGRSEKRQSSPKTRKASAPVRSASPQARTQTRPQPKPQVKSQSKSQIKSKASTEKKSNSKSSSKSRSSSHSVNRATDRSFKKSNHRSRGGKKLNFFPMLGNYNNVSSTVITTNYRCVREETITLHIPQDRLDAARFDGLTLVVVDNADRDIPVYLPPNYIEGFRLAASNTVYPSGHYVAPAGSIATPQPTDGIYNDKTGYPQN